MNEVLTTLLLFTGAAFLLLAAVGIVRMPDLYSRIQAAAKGATLGAGCLAIALAIHFNEFAVTVRALLIVAFLFLTTPVAAHVIGRAAYFIGIPLWEKSIIDELRGHYNAETHELKYRDDISPQPFSGENTEQET